MKPRVRTAVIPKSDLMVPKRAQGYIRERLLERGFDLDKPMEMYVELITGALVYEQEVNE